VARLTLAMESVAALVVLLLVLSVGYGVLLRYGFNRPQVWTDEFAGYGLVLIVMLGAAETIRRGEAIRVDLVSEHLPAGWQRGLEFLGLAAVAAVALALLVSGWEMVVFSHMVGLASSGYLELPLWLPQLLIPGGSALMLLATLDRALDLAIPR